MTFEMQEAQDQEMWKWFKIQALQKAQQTTSRKDFKMTGRELLKKIRGQKSYDDYVLWLENKLSELLERADGLVQEHMSQNQRYTDSGHSNCISAMRAFVNGVQLDVDDITEKIAIAAPEPELPIQPSRPTAVMSAKRLKNQKLS